LAPVEAAFDLVNENITAPPALNRLAGIPQPFFKMLELLNQGDVVILRQLCKRRLHNLLVRPRLGEGPHILEVSGRKPGNVREVPAEVSRQVVNDLGPHPRLSWRSKMSLPMPQYSKTSSRLTESPARTCALRILCFSSPRNFWYSGSETSVWRVGMDSSLNNIGNTLDDRPSIRSSHPLYNKTSPSNGPEEEIRRRNRGPGL
jgi:hypothetical protein